jgi:soluble lytic murein transglycosylase
MKTSLFCSLAVILIVFTSCTAPFAILSSQNDRENPDNSEAAEFSGIPKSELPTKIPQIPSAELRVSEADWALFSGQLALAKQLFRESFEIATTDNQKAAALYGLGRSYYDEKDYSSAIDAFNRIFGQYPDSDLLGDAYFMIAECYFDLGEFAQAAEAYTRYVELNPGAIDNYTYTLAGDAAMNAHDYSQAIYHYQSALQANPPGNLSYINLQIGKAYQDLGDQTTAIQYYLSAYEITEDDATKSTINLLIGQAYLGLDLKQEAYLRFMESVVQFPNAYDSFTALSILVRDGQPVDDYFRGLVDYYYSRNFDSSVFYTAIQAFDRYITANPENFDSNVYYFKGLSHFYNSEPRKAIEAYEMLIGNFPGSAYWTSAWDEKAYVQWAELDEFSNAAETYLSFISSSPAAVESAQYLYEAGRVYERAGNLQAAAETWQRLMNEYPSNDISYQGLFLAGISYFRLGQYEEALTIFQRSLVLGTNPAEKAKSYLWIGKCHQALGHTDEANSSWEYGKLADPTDYYSIRSAQLQDGVDLYSFADNYDLGYDLALEKPEADAWLISTFNLDTETDLYNLGDLASDIHLKRLESFWNLGLFEEANNEAEILRAELKTEVLKSYRLMNYLISLHLYQPAIHICRNILDMAGLDDLSSLGAPIYFTHIRFGAYFRDLIGPIAVEYNLDPLIFYSLVRLESLFNPYVESYANAIGLAQLLPSTAKENVDFLDWPPDYSLDDLYKAEINLSLGAFYLRRLRDGFNGNMQYALAAYNGGIGYVSLGDQNWIGKADGDADLFLEIIPEEKQETRDYLQLIAEFLNIYQLVYARPQ